ncbi:MAG: hypothetical protein M3R70_04140 [Actinomycetota bacterium]|nr:hypothetical protein [Actinomycetota bacterium]
MAYSKTTWQEKITQVGPTNMNKLENGLEAAAAVADAAIPKPATPTDSDIVYWDNATTSWKSKKITSAEVAATAAIPYSKLSLAGSLLNADVNAAAGIVGTKLNAARVATTVAGLGTAASGALGFVRTDASPFDLISLIYDATYAKWVSPSICLGPISAAGTHSSATFLEDTSVSRPVWVPWKALDTAGLKPQLRLMVELLLSGGAGAVEAQLYVRPTNSATTLAAAVGVTTTLISVTPGVAYKIYASDFGVFPATGVTDFFRVGIQTRSSDGVNAHWWNNATAYLRWTS